MSSFVQLLFYLKRRERGICCRYFFISGIFCFSFVFGYGNVCQWSWNKIKITRYRKLTTTGIYPYPGYHRFFLARAVGRFGRGGGMQFSPGEYRKIPKISPGAYIFQRPFLRGLFLEELIFGGANKRREVCIWKSARLILGGKFAS